MGLTIQITGTEIAGRFGFFSQDCLNIQQNDGYGARCTLIVNICEYPHNSYLGLNIQNIGVCEQP